MKWQCEFTKELKENLVMRNFIDQLNLQAPLDPREAFYGGRTNAAVLYREVADDEQIKYYDINRLLDS